MESLCITGYMLKRIWKEKRLELCLCLFEGALVAIGIVAVWAEGICFNCGSIIIMSTLLMLSMVLLALGVVQVIKYLARLRMEATQHCRGKDENN